MSDLERMIDPVWDYALVSKITPYIPAIRDFWSKIQDMNVDGPGVFSIQGDEIPPGLMYRVTNTPVRSPIKNVQIFPFIPATFLQMSYIPGGVSKMITRVCANNRLTIDEFTIIEKSNLASTYHKGQIIIVVPTETLNGTKMLGKHIYITTAEMAALTHDIVPVSVKQKMQKYL